VAHASPSPTIGSFLLVVSLVLDAALEALGKSVFGNSTATVIAMAAQSVFGLLVLTLGLNALIKWLPDVRIAVPHSFVGGFIAAILFISAGICLACILRMPVRPVRSARPVR
jgi:uncharacterized BrkB/YihY/UPF0761 family membrane protein